LHAEHLDWISHSLIEALAMAPQGLKIDLRLHVTAAPELAGAARLEHTLALSPSSTTDEKSEAPAEKSRRSSQSAGSPTGPGRGAAHGLRATAGRPDVFGILREAIDTSGGPVSVDGKRSFSLVWNRRSRADGVAAQSAARRRWRTTCDAPCASSSQVGSACSRAARRSRCTWRRSACERTRAT
jgi:hypothetical protein